MVKFGQNHLVTNIYSDVTISKKKIFDLYNSEFREFCNSTVRNGIVFSLIILFKVFTRRTSESTDIKKAQCKEFQNKMFALKLKYISRTFNLRNLC
ncbi:hypothetical protein BpHYR1_048560 [Brachionus plicatilis]|uniref:Uncharacterized protein n=1 Tax=Brachionus plicatilis TaxID=10195 RepID=A0A3M7SJG0_BRAPC|nr:hypothetical protein BpHYR1_048560 [Brachionus plicatilis]